MTTPTEEKVLDKLAKLTTRRRYHVWRLNELDVQIKAETAALARLRGVAFIRPETVNAEIERHEAGKKKEAANG